MRLPFFVLLALCLLPCAVLGSEPCDDVVSASVAQDTVEVFHEGAFYNCCAVMDFALEVTDTTIDIVETETFPTGPCYCMCCFDLSVTVGGVPPGTYWVRVFNHDRSVLYGRTQVVVGAQPAGQTEIKEFWQSDCYTIVPGNEREVPSVFFLLGEPVPNPTEGETRLFYQHDGKRSVSIQIYDPSGRIVTQLVKGEEPAGRYSILWDGEKLPSGVYFVRFSAGPNTAVRKLVIAR